MFLLFFSIGIGSLGCGCRNESERSDSRGRKWREKANVKDCAITAGSGRFKRTGGGKGEGEEGRLD